MNRREIIRQLSFALAATTLPARNFARPFIRSRGMAYKGVNYDTGTHFDPSQLSVQWNSSAMQWDVNVIRDELHCNTISLFGAEITRLTEAAAFAAEKDMHVWIQPRLFHAKQADVLQHLAATAMAAEQLRERYPTIVLNTGCEASLFTSGIIPGNSVESRIAKLSSNWQDIPAYNKSLNTFLEKAAATARTYFTGTITYSAGPWEEVDWEKFDIIGLDHYMDASNKQSYASSLRAFKRYGKPVVVTEFGCCCYEGADKAGAGGHDIIDWKISGPVIKPGYIRNEQVQADYIAQLLEIFSEEQVAGAFVYVFSNPSHPHTADPVSDLDMAGYSLVRTIAAADAKPERWERKAAFETVAGFYDRH